MHKLTGRNWIREVEDRVKWRVVDCYKLIDSYGYGPIYYPKMSRYVPNTYTVSSQMGAKKRKSIGTFCSLNPVRYEAALNEIPRKTPNITNSFVHGKRPIRMEGLEGRKYNFPPFHNSGGVHPWAIHFYFYFHRNRLRPH